MSNKVHIRTIFVDADSCPVKEEIVETAEDFPVKVLFVASYAHMKNELAGQDWRFVDSSREAADLYIMNHSHKGDVAVTQDIGLASALLLKKVYVLSPRGILFEETGISTALDLRYLAAKERRRGRYPKGPKPFRPDDRIKFKQQLTRILTEIEG